MAHFKSPRRFGSNEMWRNRLSTRTLTTDTTTNSCDSFSLHSTPDSDFTFILHHSYACW